ncbi:MAG: peptidoglycan -binding protein [Rhodobacteraceae bacterium]|jgi:chemotaxis protein MotB|nr:peptidoglycan -binding protein [Paracoccaceae bacterium]
MALNRRSGARFQASIWPGFVDAMTALLLVLMFVLTIFMIVQFILRETITGQETELDQLAAQVAGLADALGLERQRASALEGDVGRLTASLAEAQTEAETQAALIQRLTADIAAGEAERAELAGQIDDFEGQVARLLAERDTLRGALDTARAELDAGAEAARLAEARREALQALVEDLRRRGEAAGAETGRLSAALAEAEAALSDEEAARLAEAEAARLLRERLQGAETELTAMTLALEEQRRRAEETLTLLAAAEAARTETEGLLAEQAASLTQAQRDAALLAVAQSRLAEEEAASAEAQRRVTLLNEQIASLRSQLGALQAVLDESAERDRAAQVRIETLGTQLNTAIAQVAVEQRRRAELEEAERVRLEEEARRLAAEAQELERYRSDFFGRLRDILAGREGVRIVGDRFVFSSEVLFRTGSADLAPEGRAQIASVAGLLREVAAEIPPGIDWILRVDGHTDNVPLTGGSRFSDNWELSQGRALSVVRYMVDELGFPPERLAATGFGEYRPVAEGDTEEARAQNRRIELKLTER